MKFGTVFPQVKGAGDAGAVKAFAQAVEAMGFDYITVSDHVLDANLNHDETEWNAPDEIKPLLRDPFVLCGYMAGATSKLAFSSAVLVLPQRQTAVVAKQAADLDDLCGGRFRLGVGVGWNPVEYEALGVNFADRGRIFEDQIEVLRALWTQPTVTIKSPYHTISNAGLYPGAVQRPIPIWMGGADPRSPNADRILRRIARLSDGWIPHMVPGEDGRARIAKFHDYAREYGRDPSKIGIEGFVLLQEGTPDQWAQHVAEWRDMGATHIAVNSVGEKSLDIDQHIRLLAEFRKVIP